MKKEIGEGRMAIVFRNARVIDGKGGELDRGFVVVEGDRILKAGRGHGPGRRKGDQVMDLDGRSLLPGLIDCHVHFFLDGSPDPIKSLQSDSDALSMLKAARHAEITLLAGVTTVRDLGAKNRLNISLKHAIEMGIASGPRVLASGQSICMTGGHGWPFGQEADGVDGVRRAVREQLKAGADLIKLMATGGVMTPGVEPGAVQLTLEELSAGVEEAHKAGRRTACHAQGNQGIKNALRAGVDTIEHGVFLDDEALALFLAKKAFLVPTISPPFHILEKGVRSGIPAFAIEKTKRVKAIHIDSAKKAYRAGITIAMGTDAGTPLNRHGGNLKELELLVRIGLRPMEAIVAATGTAAGMIGWEDRVGTIEAGKLADLVVVEGDPLRDITLLQKNEKIVAVMKGGRFFKKVI
jgi:imidazolonepropionase-like amidohydrolase